MELAIVKYFNHLSNPWVDFSTRAVSSLQGLLLFWAFSATIMLIFHKKKGRTIFLSIILALTLDMLITEGFFKRLIPYLGEFRLRPYLAYPDQIIALGHRYTDTSFPSGHMSSTLATLTVFVYHYRKTWPIALIFALFMAFARMHNGMHYPTDVLAGTALGIGYGLLSIWIIKELTTLKVIHKLA